MECPCRFGPPPTREGPSAIFLDRDGVLVPDAGYAASPDQISLLPGVPAALRRLRRLGYRLVIVTNQSGLARGFFEPEALDRIHARLWEVLDNAAAGPDALYYCPHLAGGSVRPFARECDYRKPRPGMLLAASREMDLDLARCWMIGDKPSDIEAGISAGCRAAIRVGKDQPCRDLPAAVEVIAQSPADP